jgi:tetratricopeptide (TPR) repeat protein
MDDAVSKEPTPRAGLGRTVPADAFSPEGLRAHLARTGPTTGAQRLPDLGAETTPALERAGIAQRLARLGLRALGPPLPRFEIERVLGIGATGRVFAVEDRNLRRAVAVKFLGDGRRVADAGDIEHFVDEAQITASLEHPNVLPVHELDVTEAGEVYFTMKKIDGRSLGALIERSTPAARDPRLADLNALVSLMIGVCQALAYAHDRGLAHQDVKPDNIMIGDYGEVLLVDWGSAIRLDADGPRRLYGTPLYMSPEQARGERIDQRSDLYCLGATLFHALTLRLPAWSDDPEAFWRMKRAGEIDPPTPAERAAIPAPLLAIALKALEPDQTRRYASATDLLADLRGWQAGLSVSAHRDSLLELLARWHRRHWRALWGATATALVVLSLGAALYGERLKEIATWGDPLVDERFADDGFGARWATRAGGFERRADGVVSTGRDESSLVYRRELSGPLAIECDAEILPGTRLGDISLYWSRDQTSPLDAATTDAYRFQVGAFDGAYSAIRTSNGQHLAYSDFRPEPGRVYRIRAEIEDYRMTLAIDGRIVCDWTDSVRFDAGYVGVYAYYPGKAFHAVRIYGRGVAQKVPVTAIGDALTRLKHYDEAADHYRRIVDSHPDSDIGREALHKEAVCRWEQGRHDEARALWTRLAGTPYEAEGRLYELDELFAAGEHARLLAEMEALYGRAGAEMRKRVAMRWGRFTDAVRAKDDKPTLKLYLAYHDRQLADQHLVDINAADAMGSLGRYQELLRRYPGQRLQCAWSLIELMRPHEVVERYPDQVTAYMTACFTTGEFARIEAFAPDDRLMRQVLVKTGRAEEALRRTGSDDYAPFYACCALGRIDGALAAATTDDMRLKALCLGGRAAEAPRSGDPDSRALLALALGDARGALADATPGTWQRDEARQVLGVQACIRGDHDEARRWFAEPLRPNMRAEECFVHEAVAAFLLAPGDDGAFADALARMAAHRWLDAQRIWYLARYLGGDIDDAAFLAQPERLCADARLLISRALRRDRLGQRAEALADYRAYVALPPWRRDIELTGATECFARWRVDQLSR